MNTAELELIIEGVVRKVMSEELSKHLSVCPLRREEDRVLLSYAITGIKKGRTLLISATVLGFAAIMMYGLWRIGVFSTEAVKSLPVVGGLWAQKDKA